jgi:hypothetical protein
VSAVIGWISVFVGFVSLLAIPLFVGVIAWLIRRNRWRSLTALLLTSPCALAAGLAVLGYSRGTGRLQTVGFPDTELFNVNATTRYQSTSSGCVVSGSEWVLQLPNNLTLLALHFLMGPMPGAYDGPYPQRDELRDPLRSASQFGWAELEQDSVAVAGGAFHLRPGLGSGLAAALEPEPSDGPRCRPTVALWHDRVLVLQFHAAIAEVEKDEPLVVLVDAITGKVIAYEGHVFSTRRLPRQWT